jgi:hypothetical protein
VEVVDHYCVACGNEPTDEMPVIVVTRPGSTDDPWQWHAVDTLLANPGTDDEIHPTVETLLGQLGIDVWTGCPPDRAGYGYCVECSRARPDTKAPCPHCGSTAGVEE